MHLKNVVALPNAILARLQAKEGVDVEKTFARIHFDGSRMFGGEPWCDPT